MGLAHATQSDKLITVTQIDFCIEFLFSLSSCFTISLKRNIPGLYLPLLGAAFCPDLIESVAHLSELSIRSQMSHYMSNLWRGDCCHECLRDTSDVVTSLVTPGAHISLVSRRGQSGYNKTRRRVISNFNDHHCSIPVIFSRLYVERHLKQIYLVVI